MRLIDADNLKATHRVRIDKHTGTWPCVLMVDISKAPAIDAVPVVRCKYCKFAEIFENESYCLCLRKMAGKIRPDDFCSYGERKDGE